MLRPLTLDKIQRSAIEGGIGLAIRDNEGNHGAAQLGATLQPFSWKERAMSNHLPFMQFYPADWIQDTQGLNLKAQGAWIKLICSLWVSQQRGIQTFTKRQLNVFLTSANDDETLQIIVDLDTVADIEWRDIDGNLAENWEFAHEITITCRRMVREEAKRIQGLEADRRYREQKTSTKRPKNVSKTSRKRTQNVQDISEVRSQKSEVIEDTDDRQQIDELDPDPNTMKVIDLVESWNDCFKGKLPEVQWPLSKTRHTKAAARLREHRALDFWQKVFNNIATSKFLLGSNNGTWRCSLDFLIANDTNVIKIFEGAYNHEQNQAGNSNRR